MGKNQSVEEPSGNTEAKIIEAARQMFMQKGYAGTRTRDIADKAGINLALLNYYFRSKEKLFLLIMKEKIQLLVNAIIPVANDETLTLEEKLQLLVENYFDLLLNNPDLPLFVMGEVQANPMEFRDKLQVPKILKDSSLVNQLRERKPDLEPVQFILSVLGLIVFPFISRQILFTDIEAFNRAMNERKGLVNGWLKTMLQAD